MTLMAACGATGMPRIEKVYIYIYIDIVYIGEIKSKYISYRPITLYYPIISGN